MVTGATHQPSLDPCRPSPARMNDYALGGKDNHAVDRAAVDGIREVLPEVSAAAWANRGFH
ncbi:MAG: SAM-dependent methyltransferase, partial [Streptosporangiaceae bacterium]